MTSKKKLMLFLLVLGALFLLSGCSVPMAEDPETGVKSIILITNETTFQHIMTTESWFSAFFVFPLAKAINYLSPITGVASAVAIVTVLVNVVIMAITMKSTVATQRMQMLQPEMNKITKKYEGKTDEASKMKQAQEMQALYKKYDINPFGTILTTFVQFPIMFAIYHAVQRADAVKYGSFMGLSLEKTPLQGISSGEYLYILLFIVMIIAQLGSMKLPQLLSDYKAKKEAEKHHRKYVKTPPPGGNMMYMMMVVILVLAISWPAAMTIYWIISSAVMIGKTLLVQFVFMKDKEIDK